MRRNVILNALKSRHSLPTPTPTPTTITTTTTSSQP